jgi:hypothetical protein
MMNADDIYAALRDDIFCLLADYHRQALDDGHHPTNVSELLELWSGERVVGEPAKPTLAELLRGEAPAARPVSFGEKFEYWLDSRVSCVGMINWNDPLLDEVSRQILQRVLDSPLSPPLLSAAECKTLMEEQHESANDD